LTHVKPKSVHATLLQLRAIFKDADISKKEALAALEEARKEVYYR
jgi:hypothetical protein